MIGYHKPDAGDLAAFECILPGRVLTSGPMMDDYSHDEMTEYGRFPPDAVLLCETTDEVSRVLRYCDTHGIAVTPRGAGTGLCGGCVAIYGGVVLSTERMKKIFDVDTDNMTLTLEPGVLLMEIPDILEGTGLFYPPDPGEKSATIGGNVMTNAGGMRAVRYGVTRDYVLGAELVLADGSILTLGGKIAKNASGYSLIHLLIGSEGTLGVLTRLTVRLIPCPAENVSILVPFPDLQTSVQAVPFILKRGELTCVECMEKGVIEDAETYLGKPFPNKNADAFLLVRLDGPSREALDQSLANLTELLLSLGALDVLLADTEERKASVWDARGAFLEAINGSTPSMDECDVVVPRNRIASLIEKSARIGREYGLRIRSFGHAGDGNLHVYACKDDLPDDEWERRRSAVMDALYEEARLLGGQVSGEHGIGHAKAAYLRASADPKQMALMRGIKAAFDPNGILNPGKVLE
ncbi:MAG: FAD-binding protein [Clostridia bacterium]|nr:FAD-binding protein [Clostridia bacterium]